MYRTSFATSIIAIAIEPMIVRYQEWLIMRLVLVHAMRLCCVGGFVGVGLVAKMSGDDDDVIGAPD